MLHLTLNSCAPSPPSHSFPFALFLHLISKCAAKWDGSIPSKMVINFLLSKSFSQTRARARVLFVMLPAFGYVIWLIQTEIVMQFYMIFFCVSFWGREGDGRSQKLGQDHQKCTNPYIGSIFIFCLKHIKVHGNFSHCICLCVLVAQKSTAFAYTMYTRMKQSHILCVPFQLCFVIEWRKAKMPTTKNYKII